MELLSQQLVLYEQEDHALRVLMAEEVQEKMTRETERSKGQLLKLPWWKTQLIIITSTVYAIHSNHVSCIASKQCYPQHIQGIMAQHTFSTNFSLMWNWGTDTVQVTHLSSFLIEIWLQMLILNIFDNPGKHTVYRAYC